ncbi:hypothetical protein KKE03_04380, partial [Patescibacteria group bacterium]|nr:hypothetical protein [Patescibacteria group bacterium]
CGTGEARATGLVSSPTLAGNFGSTGACIIDQKAAFAPYEIPTYDDLKSIYYTQAKSSDTSVKEPPQASKPIKLDGAKDHIYNITEDLTISSPSDITGNQTGVIFVDGNLTIGPIPGNKLTTGASVGLVFVVEDDVNIDPTVTQIDAVIISSGKIYTAGSGCTHTSPVSGSQLVINGGLVSLGDGNIEFCRTLSDNNTAAEKIVHQSKYLIILRDLFARNEQFWSEVQ